MATKIPLYPQYKHTTNLSSTRIPPSIAVLTSWDAQHTKVTIKDSKHMKLYAWQMHSTLESNKQSLTFTVKGSKKRLPLGFCG